MQKVQDKPASAQEVLKFFDWSFKNGQKMADELDYVALPSSLIAQIEDSWKTQIKDASGSRALEVTALLSMRLKAGRAVDRAGFVYQGYDDVHRQRKRNDD